MDFSDKQQPRISPQMLETATDFECDKCKHNFFIPVFMLKRLSAIVSPTGQEINFPVQTFGCAKCGHVNDTFIPKLNKNVKE